MFLFVNILKQYIVLESYHLHTDRYRYECPTVRYLFKKISHTVTLMRLLITLLAICLIGSYKHPLIGAISSALVLGCLIHAYLYSSRILTRLHCRLVSTEIKDEW